MVLGIKLGVVHARQALCQLSHPSPGSCLILLVKHKQKPLFFLSFFSFFFLFLSLSLPLSPFFSLFFSLLVSIFLNLLRMCQCFRKNLRMHETSQDSFYPGNDYLSDYLISSIGNNFSGNHLLLLFSSLHGFTEHVIKLSNCSHKSQ